MEESRCKSRAILLDPIYDHIQQQRFKKHTETLERLRSSDKKSNSDYLVPPARLAESLDRAKKAQISVHQSIFPPNIEFQNCQRRVEHVQRSYAKLPKISNLKLDMDQPRRKEKSRIDKQNEILVHRLQHISYQKSQHQIQQRKFIQNYETYKKISRRKKSIPRKLSIKPN